MTVIHRYISRMFFKYFSMILAVVIAIYLSIDFFRRIDNFISDQAAAADIFAYFFYKSPLIISQITPVAVLLSVLIVLGLMSKNNEIVALKSGGVSAYYLLKPLIIIGLGLSLVLFVFSETLVPISVAGSNRIVDKKVEHRKKLLTSREKNIWIRGEGSFAHISYYNPSNQTIFGVSIVYFDKGFDLTKRINAQMGAYTDGRWVLYDCMIQQIGDASDAKQVLFYDKKAVYLELSPSDLKQVEKESEEMSFAGMLEYIQKVESQGYDATKYRVNLYAKTAFPMVCFIMVLVGSGIALAGRTREGMAASFAYGIVTALVYWSVYSFCLSLGYGDILPPLAAAWMTNLIFLCVAGVALLNLE
jgi:lipopolysaccharide export system permease protein